MTKPPDPDSIRLVALDIDGTLVGSEGHVSPRVRRAVKETLDHGVMVVLCTGRSFSLGIRDLAAELGLSLPAIVRNGTSIQDTATGAILDQFPLPQESVQATLDLMLSLDATPVVEEGPRHGDGLFTLPPDECHVAVHFYAELWQRAHHLRHVGTAPELYDVCDPNWIGGCGDRETTERIYTGLAAIPGIAPYWTGNSPAYGPFHCAGASRADISKASALAHFAASHGILLSEVLAVGDYLNDIEMLAEVGWGVAMGHAPEPVKAVANAVVPDLWNDGAAVALERYVLGGVTDEAS